MTKILEGGVQRAGDRVRVNVQLIDAATDAHLWAESYDRELTAANIFAIQSEVAAAIAGALKATLTPAEQARVDAMPTQNLEAWEAYQLGKQRMARRTSAALAEAEGHFRKAIALDPKFALAWVGLADTLTLQTVYSGRPRGRRARRGRAGGRPGRWSWTRTWPRPGPPRASSRSNRLQLERAEQMLRRAIALNPNYAPAHHWLSMYLDRTRPAGRGSGGGGARRRARSPVGDHQQLRWATQERTSVASTTRSLAYRQAIEIDPTMPAPYCEYRRCACVRIRTLRHGGAVVREGGEP